MKVQIYVKIMQHVVDRIIKFRAPNSTARVPQNSLPMIVAALIVATKYGPRDVGRPTFPA